MFIWRNLPARRIVECFDCFQKAPMDDAAAFGLDDHSAHAGAAHLSATGAQAGEAAPHQKPERA